MNKFNKYFAIALSSLALASSVQADSLDVRTGATSLSLSQEFFGLIDGNDVSVKKVIPGKVKIKAAKQEISFSFPISGGAIDTESLLSEVTQSGGFNLSTKAVPAVEASEGVDAVAAIPAVSVSITDLVVTVPAAGGTATVSALITVDQSLLGRVALFDIALGSEFTAPLTVPNNKKIVIKNVEAKLNPAGAAALNDAFNVTDFTSDTVVGNVTVNAIVVKKSL